MRLSCRAFKKYTGLAFFLNMGKARKMSCILAERKVVLNRQENPAGFPANDPAACGVWGL